MLTSRKRDPKHVLKSIAYQLAERIPEYCEKLNKLNLRENQNHRLKKLRLRENQSHLIKELRVKRNQNMKTNNTIHY